MGNTCFLNSTLQCLTYTCPMVNYLLSGRHDHTYHKSSCLMCIFHLHILKAFSCTDIPFEPLPFILQLKRGCS
uniref:Peptidase C19 ubiquitin carboxyl-terminal hydrolase domain-containing protein n=1 Tax=Eptatretus burgeri TaxID=7764 RepID=A0A8C4WXU2_EPTBU